MLEQIEIPFPTSSPINREKLSGQNKKLFDYLSKGNTIHCYHEARKRLRIGYLNSRVSDLINVHHIRIYKRPITVIDDYGDEVTVKEYSLTPYHER